MKQKLRAVEWGLPVESGPLCPLRGWGSFHPHSWQWSSLLSAALALFTTMFLVPRQWLRQYGHWCPSALRILCLPPHLTFRDAIKCFRKNPSYNPVLQYFFHFPPSHFAGLPQSDCLVYSFVTNRKKNSEAINHHMDSHIWQMFYLIPKLNSLVWIFILSVLHTV